MFDQDTDEPLDGTEDDPVDHDRPVPLVVRSHVGDVEPLGHLEVQLDSTALPGPSEDVLQVEVDLGSVERAVSLVDDVGELARVCGDSMYPTLHDGDIVRFIEAVEVSPSDYALVRIDGEALTVKHVEWTETGMWIRGENKDAFEDRFYTAKEIATIPIQIVGKAVEIRRAL